MFNQILSYIKGNVIAQFTIVLFVGIAIGAIFYPTKHIEERVSKQYKDKISQINQENKKTVSKIADDYAAEKASHLETKMEFTKKIHKLETKVTELNAKKKETFYKIVKPDGTIEIKKYKESEVNETTKVITKVREEFDAR